MGETATEGAEAVNKRGTAPVRAEGTEPKRAEGTDPESADRVFPIGLEGRCETTGTAFRLRAAGETVGFNATVEEGLGMFGLFFSLSWAVLMLLMDLGCTAGVDLVVCSAEFEARGGAWCGLEPGEGERAWVC